MDEDARAAFRARWREKMEGDPTKVRLYKDIGTGIATAGIEYYLPLFFDQTATIFDYLGADGHAGAARRGRRGAEALLDRHARAPPLPAARPRAADPAAGRPVPARPRTSSRCANAHRHAGAARQASRSTWARPLPDLSVDRGAPEPLTKLQLHVRRHAAPRADRRRERGPAREPARAAARQPDRAADAWPRWPSSRPATSTSRSPSRRWPRASSGTSPAEQRRSSSSPRPSSSPPAPTARRRRKQEQVSDVNALIKDLSELKVGDPVVHVNHGIGRYVGPDEHRPRRRADASSCTSSTPTRRRSTCRSRSCT